MEQKIIIAKHNNRALFLYRKEWSEFVIETNFVIATLQNKDITKHIGQQVDDWSFGHYFENDLNTALDTFYDDLIRSE